MHLSLCANLISYRGAQGLVERWTLCILGRNYLQHMYDNRIFMSCFKIELKISLTSCISNFAWRHLSQGKLPVLASSWLHDSVNSSASRGMQESKDVVHKALQEMFGLNWRRSPLQDLSRNDLDDTFVERLCWILNRKSKDVCRSILLLIETAPSLSMQQKILVQSGENHIMNETCRWSERWFGSRLQIS